MSTFYFLITKTLRRNFCSLNSVRGFLAQLINNRTATVCIMDNQVLYDEMISFIALKFRSHSLVEIGVIAINLKIGFKFFGTYPLLLNPF